MTRDENDKRSGRSKRSHGARRDSSIERSRPSGSVNRPRRRSQQQQLDSAQTSRSRSKNASTAPTKRTTPVKAALRQRAWIVPCSVAGVVVLVTLGIIVWSLMRPDHSNTATTVTGSKTEAKPEKASSTDDDAAIANSEDDESGVSTAKDDQKQPKKQTPRWNANILARNRTFELPKRGSGASADSQELAKIHLPENAPIELKLIAPRSGKANKAGLYLNASDGETALLRSWTVTRKSTDTFGMGRMTSVGQFQLANDSLTFAWDENIPDWANPLTLTYCLLEITVGDKTETCALGKPDSVEDIPISFHQRCYEPELRVNTNALDEPRSLFVDLVCTRVDGDADVTGHKDNQNKKESTDLALFEPLIGWQIGQRKVFTIERTQEQQRAMNQQHSFHDDVASRPRGNAKNAPTIEVEIELAYDENKGLYLKWRTYTFMQDIVYPKDWFSRMEKLLTTRQPSVANLENLYQTMREFRVTEPARTRDAITLKDVDPVKFENANLSGNKWSKSIGFASTGIDNSVGVLRPIFQKAIDTSTQSIQNERDREQREKKRDEYQEAKSRLDHLNQLHNDLLKQRDRLQQMPNEFYDIQDERRALYDWLQHLMATYRLRYTVYMQLQGRNVHLTQSDRAGNADDEPSGGSFADWVKPKEKNISEPNSSPIGKESPNNPKPQF